MIVLVSDNGASGEGGLNGLYNESLGTVSTYYIYDRVKDRDRGVKRIWD